jgi:hypothetical protein
VGKVDDIFGIVALPSKEFVDLDVAPAKVQFFPCGASGKKPLVVSNANAQQSR